MHVSSMTGFGRGEMKGLSDQVSVEVKSVNNRFKDIRFKMPTFLSFMEIELREMINSAFSRGSFEVSINLKKMEGSEASFELDEKKIDAFLSFTQKVGHRMNIPMVFRPVDFLRNEFYLAQDDDAKRKEWHQLIRKSLASSLSELKASREKEGMKLLKIIQDHLKTFEDNYEVVIKLSKEVEGAVREKLLKRLTQLSPEIEVDQPRFMQELLYYLEKQDVDEEINRISIHLSKLKELLSASNEVGRNIDFLIQELNRETNTIGSKTGHADISHAVVQMKVQLEKIREQALNLE